MSDHFSTPFPRGPLIGAALLVGAVLCGTAGVRMTGLGASHTPDAPTVAERFFRFEDRSDGSIAVIDAGPNRVVDAVPPGTNGFLRGTLRGLARERKREGIGPEQPFHLLGHADGRLTLEDPTTGRRVDLESFGPTNAAVFARLLMLEPGSLPEAMSGSPSMSTASDAGAPIFAAGNTVVSPTPPQLEGPHGSDR